MGTAQLAVGSHMNGHSPVSCG